MKRAKPAPGPLKELRLRDCHGRALVQADAVEFRSGRFGRRGAWRFGTVVDEELRPSPRVLILPDRAPGQPAPAVVGISPQQVRQREGRTLPDPEPRRARGAALPPLSGPVVVRAAGAAARAVPRPRRPARDGAYLDYVRAWACTGCGAPPPSEAHHAGPRGVGQKTDDYRTLPLCPVCHRAVTDTGCLPGRDRQATEAIFQRTKEDLLVAWCAGAAAPAPSADDRLAEALDGAVALRRLAAVAGALLVLLISAPAWASTPAPAPRSPALPLCLFLGCVAALVALRQRAPRHRLSLRLPRPAPALRLVPQKAPMPPIDEDDFVATADGCPRCGERHKDRLTFGDDDSRVSCACGHAYVMPIAAHEGPPPRPLPPGPPPEDVHDQAVHLVPATRALCRTVRYAAPEALPTAAELPGVAAQLGLRPGPRRCRQTAEMPAALQRGLCVALTDPDETRAQALGDALWLIGEEVAHA